MSVSKTKIIPSDVKTKIDNNFEPWLGMSTIPYFKIDGDKFECILCNNGCFDMKTDTGNIRPHIQTHAPILRLIEHCKFKDFREYGLAISNNEPVLSIDGEHFHGTKKELEELINRKRERPAEEESTFNIKEDFAQRVAKKVKAMLDIEVDRVAENTVNKILQEL